VPGGRPSFHACRGVEQFFTGDFDRADEELQRAVTLLRDDAIDVTTWPLPNDLLAAVLAFVAPLRFIRGDEPEALRTVELALARCDELVFPLGPFSRGFVRVYETWMHRLRGDVNAAVDAADEVVRIGERHGFFDWLSAGHIHRCAASALDAAARPALDEMGESIARWRAVGGRILMPFLLTEQGFGYLSIGETGRAETCLAEAEETAVGQRLAEAELHRLRAELAARSNPSDHATIGHELRAGMEFAQRQGAHLFVLRCGVTHERLLGPDSLDDTLRTALEAARAVYGPVVANRLTARCGITVTG
jgi:hypothetical protein